MRAAWLALKLAADRWLFKIVQILCTLPLAPISISNVYSIKALGPACLKRNSLVAPRFPHPRSEHALPFVPECLWPHRARAAASRESRRAVRTRGLAHADGAQPSALASPAQAADPPPIEHALRPCRLARGRGAPEQRRLAKHPSPPLAPASRADVLYSSLFRSACTSESVKGK